MLLEVNTIFSNLFKIINVKVFSRSTIPMLRYICFIFCFLIFLYGVILKNIREKYHNNIKLRKYHRRLESIDILNKTKGIAICSSSGTLDNALSVIEILRNVWNVTTPAYISHCDEIDSHVHDSIKLSNVSLFNICEDGISLRLNYTRDTLRKRLRSWWCKAATLIVLPVDELIIMDHDVIWFNNPEYLYDAPGYIDTGALFFRDRVAKDNRQMQTKIEELIIREAPELNITSSKVAKFQMLHHHHHHNYGGNYTDTTNNNSNQHGIEGMSFFFKTILDKSAPALTNHQDSSVLVVDRTRHPKFLQVLTKLLITFNIGWGDKELYWISTIISGEPFAFEPFLIGSYGDCGYMLHYDPRDAYQRKDLVRPFFLNAEWLVNKVRNVGQDLEYLMSTPQLVTDTLTLHDIGSAHGCTFRFHGYVDVPFDTNQQILRTLWYRMTRKFNHHLIDKNLNEENQISFYKKQCVPMYKYVAEQLSVSINNLVISKNLCYQIGCPYVPITVNHSDSTSTIVCVPVTFDFNPPSFEYHSYKTEYIGDNCSTIITPLKRTFLTFNSSLEYALFNASVI